MAKAVNAGDLNKDPGVKKYKISGTVYTLRTLSVGEYDALQAKATEKRTDPVTDREVEVVNNQTLLRLMVSKSSGISMSKMEDIDTPVLMTLNTLVNNLHFPPTEGKEKIWEEVDDDDEVEEPGEG